ncbi:MAG: glucan 1,4-alpha-glucosidase [Phycisphaerales bacterium]|nr:glucan 1,4-alpha-glucosidase [Phycisphaerales bacterium]
MTTETLEHAPRHLINHTAAGGPGVPARWTSSAKTGVGTALGHNSHVWFTLSHGILNEVFHPHIDKACIRDMGLIITDAVDFFSEEKRNTDSEVHWLAEGVPAFRLINTCHQRRYRIEKQILTDPHRNTLLQNVRFICEQGALSHYHVYVLLAPHLGNQGGGNSAWVQDFEGYSMLVAQRQNSALAMACSVPWLKRSASYVGPSDGWHDLKINKQMTWQCNRAENGNVELMAEIDIVKSHGDFTLAIGFGKDSQDAARNAKGSMHDGFEHAKRDYLAGWHQWRQQFIKDNHSHVSPGDLSAISLAVLRTHESKDTPGGFIASLSIPWGASKGDADLAGYHLVWSRDMVEAAGALLAAGAHQDACRALRYLQTTQQPDGHWPQNMWADGSPYWTGIQMDETALPILLVDLVRREKALTEQEVIRFWPMVRLAASYLARNGPVSPQDRWEEDPGYSPFTVAAQIAALLAAADLADISHEEPVGKYLRETADVWNTSIDRWMYVTGTDWCRKFNVEGYYARIVPSEIGLRASRFQENVHVKNVPTAEDTLAAGHMVSPDALALVRFGLRTANDPRILATLKLIDSLLKVDTPSGPVWHRYNNDGYGEHEDGAPFDGTGIGRVWPLLTGERAHYELAAGQIDKARRLLVTLESFANKSGLIPEQIWDSPDILGRELRFGRPSGSAMPLLWAHGEYLKLRRSLHDRRVFDMPPHTVERYLIKKTISRRTIWRFNQKLCAMPAGKILRIETGVPAIIHWSADGWNTVQDSATHDTGLAIHIADLPTQSVPEANQIKFTFYWPHTGNWEGTDFSVQVEPVSSHRLSVVSGS